MAETGRSCWGSGQQDASGSEADAGSRNPALANGVRLRGCTKVSLPVSRSGKNLSVNASHCHLPYRGEALACRATLRWTLKAQYDAKGRALLQRARMLPFTQVSEDTAALRPAGYLAKLEIIVDTSFQIELGQVDQLRLTRPSWNLVSMSNLVRLTNMEYISYIRHYI